MITYSKFSTNRKKEFQVITTIEHRAHNYIINKLPATKDAVPFLYSLIDKYEQIKKFNTPFTVSKPYRADKNKISFQYLDQDSYDSILSKALINRNKEGFLNIFDKYCKLIRSIPTVEFTPNEQFSAIFGGHLNQALNSSAIGCLDLNFDNILVDDNSTTLIDYEWTFPFPIPLDFIIFRAITGFYGSKKSYRPNSLVSIFELFNRAQISQELCISFLKLEESFQYYVYTKHNTLKTSPITENTYHELGKDIVQPDYTHALVALNAYTLTIENEAARKNNWILKLEDAINQKDQWIAKLEKDNQELHRATIDQSDTIQSLHNKLILEKASDIIEQNKDSQLRSYVKELELENERKKSWIQKLEGALERKTSWSKKLEKDVEELNNSIANLQEQITQFKPVVNLDK
jgi:hypothetical protein